MNDACPLRGGHGEGNSPTVSSLENANWQCQLVREEPEVLLFDGYEERSVFIAKELHDYLQMDQGPTMQGKRRPNLLYYPTRDSRSVSLQKRLALLAYS